MCIYRIYHKNKDECCIGSSAKGIKKRWQQHKTALKRNCHHSSRLQNAWDKYGEDSFDIEMMEYCSDINDLIPIEQEFFKIYVEEGKDRPAYNMCPLAASILGHKHSEETRRKLSTSHKEAISRAQQIKPCRAWRPIKRTCPKTGEIKNYPSVKATKEDGFRPGHVSSVCRGVNKTHGGFFWEYLDT